MGGSSASSAPRGAGGGSLADMLGGSNPFLSALSGTGSSSAAANSNSGGSSGDPSSALLSSLLGSATGSSGSGSGMDPFGGLGSLLGMAGKDAGGGGNKANKRQRRKRGGRDSGGGGMDSLAKSVLKSLVKRIDDDRTQTQICNFCQGASADQVRMYAGMAGLQMADEQAGQIVAFAHGVTKKKLRRESRPST